jgi:hypothetical protein
MQKFTKIIAAFAIVVVVMPLSAIASETAEIIVTDVATPVQTSVFNSEKTAIDDTTGVADMPVTPITTSSTSGAFVSPELESMTAQLASKNADNSPLTCEPNPATLVQEGDINMDGLINMADLIILSAHYNQAGTTVDGDINSDGQVNFADLTILSQNYGKRLCTLPEGTACEVSPAVLNSQGDINLDGVIDMADLSILTAQYNQTGESLSADLNKDQKVEFADLVILSQNYGKVLCSIPTPTTCETNPANLHLEGDINMDGLINKADLDILALNYNHAGNDGQGDLNNDGQVEFADLVILAQNYGKRLCILPTGTACEATLKADINIDGATNMADLNILSSQYNQSGNLSADLNKDGTVEFADLVILAQEYNKVKCSLTDTPTTPTNPPTGGGTPGTPVITGGGGGIFVLGTSTPATNASLLGYPTDGTCSIYLTNFVMKNRTNNFLDVVLVQKFLRQNQGAKISITGLLNSETIAAVNAFQLKYADQILAPWVAKGALLPGEATGNVYLTTRRMINNIVCPSLNLPIPALF